MPRQPISPYWRRRVNALAADGYSPAQIEQCIVSEPIEDGRPRPSRRSIDRILADWRQLPVDEQRQYGSFRWPETMTIGVLPWGASFDALDLLRERDRRGLPRPLVREVKWFWRLRQAAPTIPSEVADRIALFLSAKEIVEQKGRADGYAMPQLDLALAYRPWESEAAAAAFQQLAESRGLLQPLDAFLVNSGDGDEAFWTAYHEGWLGHEGAMMAAKAYVKLHRDYLEKYPGIPEIAHHFSMAEKTPSPPLDEDDAG
jgi:hypothetical protein